MKKKLLAISIIVVASLLLALHLVRSGVDRPQVEALWAGDAPGAVGTTDDDRPTVSVYLPARWHASGAGMVICPGGAYYKLQSTYEGSDIARWLNSFGVAAFVLKYRISPRYHYPAPFLDAQRAVRYVRFHAAQWNIRPDRIGIIGFSAGGHLASTVITHFDSGNPSAGDPVDRVSSRPNFAILAYPIITLRAPLAPAMPVHNLLGPNPSPELIDELSNELHVTKDTPPTFLFHTNEDKDIPAENSILFYTALRKAGVPCELHIYEGGRHGLGLANGHGRAPRAPGTLSWSERAEEWLVLQWAPYKRWSFSRLFRL